MIHKQSPELRAIVFDCFGVLASDGWLPFKAKYFGDNEARFLEVSDLNKAVDAGLVSYDDFITDVADLAGVPKAAAHTEIERNPPNAELFSYITENLAPTYKIGLLSNAGANWLADLFTPDQLKLFDATVLSCDIGVIKPDHVAYEAIASKLGVELHECVFIDDQPRYCQGAIDVGMQAIHFTDNDSLIRELSLLLNDSRL